MGQKTRGVIKCDHNEDLHLYLWYRIFNEFIFSPQCPSVLLDSADDVFEVTGCKGMYLNTPATPIELAKTFRNTDFCETVITQHQNKLMQFRCILFVQFIPKYF